MNEEKVKKAFRILPNQGTGNYRFDNCSHSDHISLKATDPYEFVNICPGCLALALRGDEKDE